MKKFLSILLSTLMLFSASIVAIAAPQESTAKNVYLTVTNSDLKFEIYREQLTVTDANSDGKITVDDAFICGHNEFYNGGATAGYNAPGGFISKFWGVENGGGYMYFINNSNTQVNTTMLQTEINDGDDINLHIFSDLDTWSDSFSYFDINQKEILAGNEITLKLMKKSMFDTAPVPAENATITINDIETSYKTDANGKVTLPLNEVGTNSVSAVSSEYVLAPPMCKVIVNPSSANIFVTLVDDNKDVQLAQEKILVTDVNYDQELTIMDAMICLHDQKYPGGAASGFKTSMGQYGIQIDKLWGIENGGSYGYYLNNGFCMGLSDAIKENDYLNAFVYSDAPGYSDAYSYFDVQNKEVLANEEFSLTLNKVNFGAEPFLPVEGATIYVNGVATSFTTDANGKVVIKLDAPGTYTITANSDTDNIVPAVCTITVKAVENNNQDNNTNDSNTNNSNQTEVKSPNTGSESFSVLFGLSILALAFAIVSKKTNKTYEK